MEHDPNSRWKEIRKTSPSGKTMFVCLSCGQTTPVPAPNCSELVLVDYMDLKIRMPCSAWPMSAEEYIGKKMLEEGAEAYFSGVVLLPEGHFAISTNVPVALGRELAVRAVEKDLTTSAVEARKRKETREIVMNQVVQGTVPMKP